MNTNQEVSTSPPIPSLFNSTFLMHVSAELVMLGLVVVYFSFKHSKLKNNMLKLTNRLDEQNKQIEMLKLAIVQIQNERISQSHQTRPAPSPQKTRNWRDNKRVVPSAQQTHQVPLPQQTHQVPSPPKMRPVPSPQQTHQVPSPPKMRPVPSPQQMRPAPRRIIQPRIVVQRVELSETKPPQSIPKIEEIEESEVDDLDMLLKSELAELEKDEKSQDDLD
jgi:hypothetical protein